MINIKTSEYNSIYHGIEPGFSMQSSVNKRGSPVTSCLSRVSTCTVERVQSKLLANHGLNVSIGSIMGLKPFFLKVATERGRCVYTSTA